MKKILMSLAVVVAVGAIVAGATGAFFSDTETSVGNTFTAGAIDLGIDNESYYNGALNEGTSWALNYNLEEGCENPAYAPTADDNDEGLDDQETIPCLFFDFNDLKPGDWGEDTISIHVNNNDAWVCADVTLTSNDDNSSTEPELEDGDAEEDDTNDWDGELAQRLKWYWWADDGDNVFEEDEQLIHSGVSFPAVNASSTFTVALADSVNNIWTGQANDPIEGSSDAQEATYYIGKAWCFGDTTFTPYPEGNTGPIDRPVLCDGANEDNTTQTDGMTLDVAFYAEQSRNNESFVCGGNGGEIGCTVGDIMFVLDSSGSIDNTELGVMQAAAVSFATALAPSANGNHIGVVDFDNDATLEQQLTDILADINTAINGLVSGGVTALGDGINVASTELASVRDRNDATTPDYMVIMTDGQPNAGADAATAAQAAKDAGITLYVVGIGNGVDDTFLEGIATSSAHYFSSAEFADLEAILAQIAVCEENNS